MTAMREKQTETILVIKVYKKTGWFTHEMHLPPQPSFMWPLRQKQNVFEFSPH